MTEDIVTDMDNNEPLGINTGIGVVIPIEKILETLNQPDLLKMRCEAIEKYKNSTGTVAGLDVSDGVSPSSGLPAVKG